MKAAFARTWKASTQPRKQRKYAYNAPLHTRAEFVTSTLSKDLRKKHEVRSVTVRTGDKVKVLRGQFKGKLGKVNRVDRSKIKIFVEGAELLKSDGSKRPYPIHPSNIMIIEAATDKKRFAKKETPAKKKVAKKTTKKATEAKQ